MNLERELDRELAALRRATRWRLPLARLRAEDAFKARILAVVAALREADLAAAMASDMEIHQLRATLRQRGQAS